MTESFYLVRHCHTNNQSKQGLRKAERLSIRGVKQTPTVAQRLHELGITTIITANLLRVLDSARIVAAILMAWGKETDFETTENLNEMDFGILNDKSWAEIAEITKLSNIRELVRSQQADFRPWHGESSSILRTRLIEEIDFLFHDYRAIQTQKMRAGKLAGFSSGQVIRAAYHLWRPSDIPEDIPHGSIHKFEYNS